MNWIYTHQNRLNVWQFGQQLIVSDQWRRRYSTIFSFHRFRCWIVVGWWWCQWLRQFYYNKIPIRYMIVGRKTEFSKTILVQYFLYFHFQVHIDKMRSHKLRCYNDKFNQYVWTLEFSHMRKSLKIGLRLFLKSTFQFTRQYQPSLPVSNDQFSLTSTNWYEWIDGLNSSLHRFTDGFTGNDTRGFDTNSESIEGRYWVNTSTLKSQFRITILNTFVSLPKVLCRR